MREIIGQSEIYYDLLTSSHLEMLKIVKENPPLEGLVIFTHNQTQGRGSKNKFWHATPGKNLLLSIYIKPHFVKPNMVFWLNAVSALSVRDVLNEYTKEVKVKWSNDVMINNLKAAGILIHNQFSGEQLLYSVISIGININEDFFPENIPYATSLFLQNNIIYPLDEIKLKLYKQINYYYDDFYFNGVKNLKTQYLKYMFKLNESVEFISGEKSITGIIYGIDNWGKLLLLTQNGIEAFFSGEISFNYSANMLWQK